jgi:hypothetical protein
VREFSNERMGGHVQLAVRMGVLRGGRGSRIVGWDGFSNFAIEPV